MGLALFGGAIWLLQRELRAYNLQDIFHALAGISNPRLLLALGLTATNFMVLSGVDLIAIRFIRRRLEYRKVLFASFTGFAISQSLGFPLITAATVRYRLYSRWGISPQEVTSILASCGLTFCLGLFAILGIILLGQPAVPTEVLRLPGDAERYIGLLLLLGVAGYLTWNAFRSAPLQVLRWKFPVAPIRMSLAQIGVSILEWALLASILYVLLPAGLISFPGVLQIVVLAQMTGIISNVPGGLGVFEAVVFLLLPDGAPEDLVLASLLAYRGIYTLLPLLIATTLLAGHEVAHRRRQRLLDG
jgi:uncharacterized membrane protein YbhN (UPF0104 family)